MAKKELKTTKLRVQLMLPESIIKDVLNLKRDNESMNLFIQNLIMSGLMQWKKGLKEIKEEDKQNKEDNNE